jgi:hypothetical protein
MAPMTEMPQTASELIDALGGTSRTADALGEKISTISNWRRRGIPDRATLHLRILDEARRAGVNLTAERLGILAAPAVSDKRGAA